MQSSTEVVYQVTNFLRKDKYLSPLSNFKQLQKFMCIPRYLGISGISCSVLSLLTLILFYKDFWLNSILLNTAHTQENDVPRNGRLKRQQQTTTPILPCNSIDKTAVMHKSIQKPSLTNSLVPLDHRHKISDLSLFCKYFQVDCSAEINSIITSRLS